jgi:hypothetical protein
MTPLSEQVDFFLVDDTTPLGLIQPIYTIEKSAFPRSVGSYKTEDFTLLNRKTDSV